MPPTDDHKRRRVEQLLAFGRSMRETARIVGLSLETVRTIKEQAKTVVYQKPKNDKGTD
jgi:DNA-binding CsgD family transcriptional regulator